MAPRRTTFRTFGWVVRRRLTLATAPQHTPASRNPCRKRTRVLAGQATRSLSPSVKHVSVNSLPKGTVTFLFTDVEGSTRLLDETGAKFSTLLFSTRSKLRAAMSRHGGIEVDCAGDGLFFAFGSAKDALAAAICSQETLKNGPAKVRMALHTGHAEATSQGYIGMDVHRTARLAAVAHGGQTIMSRSTRELVECVAKDLGEHWLKDLSNPIRIYQVGTEAFPPPRSLFRSNLPTPPTRFLGRRLELKTLTRILHRRDIRLVSLVGPGGIGKTRLALEVASRQLKHYPDGVWWLPLALNREPGLVTESIARALSVSGDLFEYLSRKKLMLVFDSFEHVLGAAPVVSQLVQSCPNLTVIVTTRAPLELASEWRYVVDPLSEMDAVALCVLVHTR